MERPVQPLDSTAASKKQLCEHFTPAKAPVLQLPSLPPHHTDRNRLSLPHQPSTHTLEGNSTAMCLSGRYERRQESHQRHKFSDAAMHTQSSMRTNPNAIVTQMMTQHAPSSVIYSLNLGNFPDQFNSTQPGRPSGPGGAGDQEDWVFNFKNRRKWRVHSPR